MKRKHDLTNSEVQALVDYAARRGLAPDLVKAIPSGMEDGEEPSPETLQLYAALAEKTKPVNGRTVLDSSRRSVDRLAGIACLACLFFVLAVGNEIADQWIADTVEPEEPSLWLPVKRYAWDYLTPFFWGALGSCVYLLKKIQDLAASFEYEHAQLRGWLPRILLGAILGASIQYIFDPASFTAGGHHLSANAIAFLTGIGVKVVYGGIEKVIEELSNALNLDKLGKAKPEAQAGEGS